MLRDSGSKTVDSKMGDNYTLASFGSRDPESGCCWELVSVKKLNAALASIRKRGNIRKTWRQLTS